MDGSTESRCGSRRLILGCGLERPFRAGGCYSFVPSLLGPGVSWLIESEPAAARQLDACQTSPTLL
jgi:hypothetical protein